MEPPIEGGVAERIYRRWLQALADDPALGPPVAEALGRLRAEGDLQREARIVEEYRRLAGGEA